MEKIKHVCIRCTEAEHQDVKAMAKKWGMSTSEYFIYCAYHCKPENVKVKKANGGKTND